jgi:ABC-type antimicrobial peptide transport system permease subunit
MLSARQAFLEIRSHPLRSGLTLSGIVAGVAALVGSLALTDAVRRMTIAEYERNGGASLATVASRSTSFKKGIATRYPRIYPVDADDAAYLRGEIPSVASSSGHVSFSAPVASAAVREDHVMIEGVEAAYFEMGILELKAGRFFTSAEDERGDLVAVLTPGLAEKLCGRDVEAAAGREISIESSRFKVVGVAGGADTSEVDHVYIPYRTAIARLDRSRTDRSFWIKAREAGSFAPLESASLRLLTLRHPGSKAGNFEVDSDARWQDAELKEVESEGSVLRLLALLTLLAGTIGIANVFFISVRERTREIGTRRAVGARRGDVLRQFLLEALAFSALGGAVGVLCGWAFGHGLAMLVGSAKGHAPLAVVLRPSQILLGLAVALISGVVAGVLPAIHASSIEPAEALRRE